MNNEHHMLASNSEEVPDTISFHRHNMFTQKNPEDLLYAQPRKSVHDSLYKQTSL